MKRFEPIAISAPIGTQARIKRIRDAAPPGWNFSKLAYPVFDEFLTSLERGLDNGETKDNVEEPTLEH